MVANTTPPEELDNLDQVFCPGCGEEFRDGAESCPNCGADHIASERMRSLLNTAEKEHNWGISGSELVFVLLPIILWRQTRIENAQRELIMYRNQFGESNSEPVYCHGCGSTLSIENAECNDCGLENPFSTIESLDLAVHDPREHETGHSNRWWVGPVLGPFVSSASLYSDGTIALVLFLGFEAGILITAVLDRNYVRANGTWSPSYALLLGLLIPLLNIGLAVYYVWKRGDTLGWGNMV